MGSKDYYGNRSTMTAEKLKDLICSCDCDHLIVHDVVFDSVKFKGLYFKYTWFENCSFVDCTFSNCDLNNCSFRYCDMRYIKVSKDTNLIESRFELCDLIGSSIWGTNTVDDILILNCAVDSSCFCRKEVRNCFPMVCPEKGSFTGWKQCWYSDGSTNRDCIVELEIPADAKRLSYRIGKTEFTTDGYLFPEMLYKCRASKAIVKHIYRPDGSLADDEAAYSYWDSNFEYRVGEVVRPRKKFSVNRAEECASGIHFFMTREEAEAY